MHSFHLHTDQRQVIQQVFKAYGLEATVDDSVRTTQIRLDMDDANFDQAMRVLGPADRTRSIVPLDAHRVLVAARYAPKSRLSLSAWNWRPIYLPGLTPTELTEVGNLAKNVFDVQQAVNESDCRDDHASRAGEDAQRLQRHDARTAGRATARSCSRCA